MKRRGRSGKRAGGGGASSEKSKRRTMRQAPPSRRSQRLLAGVPRNWANEFDDLVWTNLLSYCDVTTLANLDATSKAFPSKTSAWWKKHAFQRFGMFGAPSSSSSEAGLINPAVSSVGKKHWRAACALVHPDIAKNAVVVPLARHHDGKMYTSPRLAFSEATGDICIKSDDPTGFEEAMTQPVVVRKSPLKTTTFEQEPTVQVIDTSPHGVSMWTVFCGSQANELLVTCDYEGGNIYAMWRYKRKKQQHHDLINRVTFNLDLLHDLTIPPELLTNNNSQLLPWNPDRETPGLVGCEHFLLAAYKAHFFVFVPDEQKLLRLAKVTLIDDELRFRATHHGLAWTSPELGRGTFCVSAQPGHVGVWQVQVEEQVIVRRADDDDDNDGGNDNDDSVTFRTILNIHAREEEAKETRISEIAVSSSYVAFCLEDSSNYYVYNHQGELLHVLYEESVPEFGSSFDVVSMFATGEILVTSSEWGTAICVWDMRRGQLVHCFMDLLEGSNVPEVFRKSLDRDMKVTAMVPLWEEAAICFTCMLGGLFVRVFTHNNDRKEWLQVLASCELADEKDRNRREEREIRD